MNQQSHEEWLANREERRHEHIEIDREEVREYFLSAVDDALQDGADRLIMPYATDQTLDFFEERGLTAELLQEIIDDWSA